ncbi:MAG: hypothetical protein ACE5G0_16875 [Rhodothermales bacterium]
MTSVSSLLRRIALFLFVVSIAVASAGCDSDSAPDTPESPFIKASDWVANVDWDTRTTVEVTMVESGDALSFSPNELTFEAGKPYVLKIVNPLENRSKHYFSPDLAKDFFRAIATRKVQTDNAEYKAPYFKAVELLIGGELEIYFVPVLGGTYDFLCTITGHADAGMVGKITITGGEGYELDLEVDQDFDTNLTTDARTSGSDPVWSDAQEVTIQMLEHENGTLGYEPPVLHLAKDAGYTLTLDNAASNKSKHYYTAAEFYKTVVIRKAEDARAEIKVPYLNAVELLIGGRTELFVVPTEVGTFEVTCTIPGHHEAGMHGRIEVQ